jgi:hypothetical protein
MPCRNEPPGASFELLHASGEQALALDRNLAEAHALVGVAKLFLGEETEPHIQEALRLSPRDIFAHR